MYQFVLFLCLEGGGSSIKEVYGHAAVQTYSKKLSKLQGHGKTEVVRDHYLPFMFL